MTFYRDLALANAEALLDTQMPLYPDAVIDEAPRPATISAEYRAEP